MPALPLMVDYNASVITRAVKEETLIKYSYSETNLNSKQQLASQKSRGNLVVASNKLVLLMHLVELYGAKTLENTTYCSML